MCLLTMSLLYGCGGSDSPTTTEEGLSSAKASTAIGVQSVAVNLVGDGKQLFNSTKNVAKGELRGRPLAKVPADLSNESEAVEMKSGHFYDISIAFNSDEDHPDGIPFEITLVNSDNESSIIDSVVSDATTAGDSHVILDTLIPAEMKSGDYYLIATALKENLDEIATESNTKTLNDIPEMGGIHVKIVQDENAVQIDMVDALIEEPYIDLEYPGDFAEDSYTFESIGDVYISVYNTSSNSQDVVIQGVLTFEDGSSYNLGLLDTEKDAITDELNYSVPSNGEESTDLSLVYFIHEDDYEDILNKIPDLSLDEDSDGKVGEIEWTLSKKGTEEISTEPLITEVSLAKLGGMEEFDIEEDDNEQPLSRTSAKTASDITKEIFNTGKLFSFEGKDEKVFGKKSKFALSGSYNYSAEGIWSLPSVKGEGKSDISVFILNAQNKVLSVESEVQASVKKINPNFEDAEKKKELKRRTGMKIVVTALGATYYEKDTMAEEDPSELSGYKLLTEEQKNEKKKEVVEESKEEKKGLSMPKYEWKEKKEIVSQRMFVGPVPIKIAAGIRGSLEVNTGLEMEGLGIALKAELPIKIEGFLAGGIDVLVTKAGVEGAVEFVDFYVGKHDDDNWEETGITAGIRINDSNKFEAFTAAQTDIRLNILKGKVGLYAATKTKVKICRKWGVPYPCGLDWNTARLNIYESPWAFKRQWNLLKMDKSFALGGF